MSDWTAASLDCSRPVNDYVHIKTADLYRPNARFTPERQGYQVLTPFGKLGYSLIYGLLFTRIQEGLPPLTSEELLEALPTLLGIVVVLLGWATVWTKYFQTSVRVSNTFGK